MVNLSRCNGWSALNHVKILEDNDFFEFKISCKASDVFLAVAAYYGISDACKYPIHLGITEAEYLEQYSIGRDLCCGLVWAIP